MTFGGLGIVVSVVALVQVRAFEIMHWLYGVAEDPEVGPRSEAIGS